MKTALIILLVALLFGDTFAQKLPNLQQGSLRAPVNLKIDGKADEWNEKFQALNNATEVFYTMSNDSENLYLIIQSKQQDVTNKILMGRITLAINTNGKQKDENAVTITYPIFEINDIGNVTNALSREAAQG